MHKILYSFVLVCFVFNAILSADGKSSALFDAVNQKDFAKVKELVESGVDVNTKGKVGFSALLLAAGWGDVQMVEYLIKHGASLEVRSDRGMGVIHRASMNKNPKVLAYLLKNYDFDVNDRGKRYCAPLDFALRYNALQDGGSLENAKLLLEHGAKKSIDFKCRGYTPLMVAVPDEKVVRFLLKYGAKKDILNASKKSAYDMARDQKASQKVLDMLSLNDMPKRDKKVFEDKNLIWELKTVDNKYDQYAPKEAEGYCKNLDIDGVGGWRIPTVKEYQTILSDKPFTEMVIDGVGEYYLNPKIFKQLTPSTYWVVLEDGSLGAESISFNKVYTYRKNDCHHIRCVKEK